MQRDAGDWFALLLDRDPRIDRTLLRIIAGLLAREGLHPDIYLILADALDEAARESIGAGRPLDALPFRLLRNLLATEAARRRGSFW